MGLISRVSSRTYRNPIVKTKTTTMVCVKDVNQSDFVLAFAAFLKKSGKVSVPKWNDYAKTATQKQNSPVSDDWFYSAFKNDSLEFRNSKILYKSEFSDILDLTCCR